MPEGESIKGGFPPISIPNIPFTWETFMIILPYAGIVAGVGLIESLLTLNIIDEITQTRGRGNKECVAQGTANILSGFLSGMGGLCDDRSKFDQYVVRGTRQTFRYNCRSNALGFYHVWF